MRVSAAFVLILIVSAQLLAIGKSSGQSLDTPITLELKNETLFVAFKKIEVQSGFFFIYNPDDIQKYPAVSLDNGTRTVRETLEIILASTTLKYGQHEDKILVQEPLQPQSFVIEPETARVSGKITDGTNGTPMAGVNVVVKGTTNGTTTDALGIFVIDANPSDILVFSFIGFKVKEESVGNRAVIDITLEEDVNSLQQVTINAGYWDVKDRERTGNISRVPGEQIRQQPISNPLQALQGRMPGVYIQQRTGLPGGNIRVMIRGVNSLRTDGNDPLYVVDGVPFSSTSLASSSNNSIIPSGSPFNYLNPNDIESIEILKDADATSIYGSRGANGVVLITTRKGTPGKARVDMSVFQGISKVPRKLDLLNTQQYLEMRKEGFRNDSIQEQLVPENANKYPDLLRWDTTRYTNWQKELIGGTSKTTNVQVSITGGDADMQYIVGGGYLRQGTVFPGDFSDQKFSGNVSINRSPEDKRFGFKFSANYLFDDNRLLQNDLTNYITLAPNAPKPFNDDGSLNWEENSWVNPYSFLSKPYESKTNNLISNLILSYRIAKGLHLKSITGFNRIQTDIFSATTIKSLDPKSSTKTGSAVYSDNSVRTWNVEPQIEYIKTIGSGKLTALVGATFLETNTHGEDIQASGYITDILIRYLKSAPTVTSLNSRYALYRYQAFFGRLNFNWMSKYFVNLTGRRDGSSRFGPDNRFSTFGAVGAAWIFTNEGFLLDNAILSFGKIRTSYGTTGSDQIANYQYLDSYSAAGKPYQGATALIPTQLANPNYSWESNRKFEAAIDLGFLSDRFLLSASYYNNRSSNQLVGYSLPEITGFASIQYNLPATVQNTGLELELSTRNISTTNVTWTSSVNITFPKNKLVEYPNFEASTYANTYEVGKSLFIKKYYHYTGVDPQTGMISYQDIDGDGEGASSNDDLQALKEVTQKFYGGINNSITYKGFQLNVFFQFVKQTGWDTRNSPNLAAAPGTQGNQLVDVMNRWRSPGDVTNHQKFTADDASDAALIYNVSTYRGDNLVVNASFIRLQNIQLSWQLPASVSSVVHIQNCKILLQGQNVFTITNYKGLDPETQSQSVLPSLRTITCGLQISL